jgi:TonB family protein
VLCVECEGKPVSDEHCERCGNVVVPGAVAVERFPSAKAAKDEPVTNSAPTAEEAAAEESLWSQLMNTPAPPRDPFFEVEVTPAVAAIPPTTDEPTTLVLTAEPAKLAAPALAHESVSPSEVLEIVAPAIVSPEPAPVDHRVAKTVRLEPEKPAVKPEPRVDTTPRRVPRSPSPHRAPEAIAATPSSGGLIAFAAVVVMLTAGAGMYWLKLQGEQVTDSQDGSVVSAKDVLSERQPPPPDVERPVKEQPPSGPQKPRPQTSQKPKTAKPATSRSASEPTREAAPAAAPILPAEPPTVVTPSTVEVASARPESREAPVSPFFETTSVNESPRISTRVEPEVPAELRGKKLDEIVIVRMLVSHNGHPFRVSLLRKSKTGPLLDSAVIAAVSQWTFTPARKKGEPVSCWFNMGVPVGMAD